jgi:dimethylhistidine N-methyltransferase
LLKPSLFERPALVAAPTSGFAADLRQALSQHPRSISPKYFYDAQGSALFDQICQLPEYYPTRVELAMLKAHAGEMAQLMGAQAEIIEFGAGSCVKVGLLLDAMHAPSAYRPIDISGEHLSQACTTLAWRYPTLNIAPLVADYTQAFELPAQQTSAKRIGFFPGSTIGNFTPPQALAFLTHTAQLLQGGALLLGADLIKDPAVLHAAYNDAQGVTAAFNLNLLARANSELQCNFALDQFAHSAFYNPPERRIEMHLMSLCRQQVQLGQQSFTFEAGDSLHTENSYKFTIDSLRALATQAGFQPGPVWTDPQQLFSLHWLQAPPI